MFYYQRENEFFAQVAGGLEDLLAIELESLGATNIRVAMRGITFNATLPNLFRINYRSRLATRILAPLVKFEATTAEALYLGAKKVDWTRIFTLEQTFAVFGNVHRSNIDHGHFAALKVKDCVVDMFRKRYRDSRPNVKTDDPDLWLSVHIYENQATISIDCSGGSLHRRGYRQHSVSAPMMETLAASIIDFAEWDLRRPFYDPMCGSGTMISEAWLKAGNIPAGTLRKKFGFMMLPDYDRRDWVRVKFEEDNKIKIVRGGMIKGSDIDRKAVKMTRENNAKIPDGDELRVKTMDFRDIDKIENSLIVCNPPYGIRMKKGDDMGAFMRDFGDFLKQKCTGSDAYIYLGDPELIKSIGLKPTFKKPLRNGGLDGRLVKYELY
jgi:putative N6-adenine-specific DNA methylase